MPAQSTGLEGFGGNGSIQPNITVSNALGNTPFLGAVANAGVGTGSLGEFGGYIPTPLPQFNNYADYMQAMPGASQMDRFANQPLNPAFNMWDSGPGSPVWGLTQDLAANQEMVPQMQGAREAMNMATGWNQNADGTYTEAPGGGFIQQQWLPAANKMYGYANTMAEQGNKMFGLEDPIIQAGYDPQNALYARTSQQLQDQTRAGLEARGLGMDPYGAGVEGATMSNFNIDWQNNQLQRMTQAAQAAGGLAGVGGGLMQGAGAMNTSAAQLQDLAANEMYNFNQLPFQTISQDWNQQFQDQQRLGEFGMMAEQPYQLATKNWQDIQNQFLTANQQSFNQNQTSGFEDPFAMLQLQSQIEMQREQMNMQEEMQKRQMQQQMAMQGAQAGMGMLGGK